MKFRARERNRLDHILPQGYLDGFTNPRHPGNLAVYNCKRRTWFDSGTRRVSADRGFYDYTEGTNPPQTADGTFKKLEDTFPALRRELVTSGFSMWEKHLTFLLTFAQMLRARSRLFREHVIVAGQNLPMGRVDNVSIVPSTTRLGESDTQIQYSPIAPGAERNKYLKNKAIMDMCAEISKGPDWMSRLHWSMLLTGDPASPVVTADQAITVAGQIPTLGGAFYDHRTRVFFPICWQACLVGSHARVASLSQPFDAHELKNIRSLYMSSMQRFAYSPVRLVE